MLLILDVTIPFKKKFFNLHIQYLCNQEEDFEAGLAAIADVGIDNV